MRDKHDICIAKTKPADRTRIKSLAKQAEDNLLMRYRSQRSNVNNEQTGTILQLFCSGSNSSDISAKVSVPIEAVRAIISYACSRSILLYKWHAERTVYTGFVNSEAPVRAESYIRYAPEI